MVICTYSEGIFVKDHICKFTSKILYYNSFTKIQRSCYYAVYMFILIMLFNYVAHTINVTLFMLFKQLVLVLLEICQ